MDPLATGCDKWLARYAHPGSSDDSPDAVVMSPNGARVFVAGTSGRVQGFQDFATAAYDVATGQRLWAASYDGPGHYIDEIAAIQISPDGNHVYVTGKSAAASTGGAPSYEYATIAYDAITGTRQWVARFNGVGTNPGVPVAPATAQATDLKISPDGARVYVTGQSSGTLGTQYSTVAYDSLTGSQLWSSNYSGLGGTYGLARSITVSPDGSRVFVTGVSANLTNQYDYGTVAYDSATGAEIWAATYDGPYQGDGYDDAASITISPDGSHVYVTGSSVGANGYPDYATISYETATGGQQWLVRYSSPGGAYNLPTTVKVSPNGQSVFVTGENVTFIDDQHSISEYPTVAYDSASGTQKWVAKYPGPNNDSRFAVSLAISPDGQSVYAVQMAPDHNGDFATVKYDATTGAQQWVATYDAPASGMDQPSAIAVSNDGTRLIVTGGSFGTETLNDFAVIRYNTTNGAQQWIARYNGSGVNDEWAAAIAASPDGKTVYVSGFSDNGTPLGLDYATTAYDAVTGAQKWLARYHRVDSSYEIARSMAVSHNGQRVYVTGYSTAGYNGAPSQYTTVAYDAATGAQLWVALFAPPRDSDINTGTAQAIAISPDDTRVYVTGNVAGSKDFVTSYDEIGTIAYDAKTGAELWTAYYDGAVPGLDIGWSIGVTPDGQHVVVSGETPGIGNPLDFATVCYNAATGAQQWASTYNNAIANSFDVAHALVVSPDSSSVYVTGESYQIYNAYAYSTIGYDIATGTQKWQQTYSGSAQLGDVPAAIAISPDSTRVYVTGSSANTGTGGDYGTVAYNAASGAQVWTATYAQPGAEFGNDIAVSPNGSFVVVTGESAGALSHGDFATVIYDATSGTEKLAARYDGPAGEDDIGAKVSVSTDSSRIFVTGLSPGAGTGTDYATLAYDTSLIGVTPPNAVPLNGVASRKSHGADNFEVNVPTTAPPAIECRDGGANGAYTLVFTFGNSLTSVGGATVTSGTGSVSSSAIGIDQHQYIVNLTDVTNAQVITVNLVNVNDASGNHTNSVSVSLGILLGDTNGDGSVNSADIAQTKSTSGQPLTTSNFREDLNADGFLNSADISLAKSKSGTGLP